jgi:peptide/nickel transport system substrate-binding protein
MERFAARVPGLRWRYWFAAWWESSMRGRRRVLWVPITVLACGLAACAGGSRASAPAAPDHSAPDHSAALPHPAPSFDAGLSHVVSPSAATGGVLTFDLAGAPDSLDYQNTSDEFVADFARLYSMQLMTYRSCPGGCGLQLVPGLAEAPGQVSDHGLLWTYHLRPDVRFQDGQLVTAADVKYGIERSYSRTVLPFGPDIFQSLLADPGYGGPYADPAGTLTSISTPNATTIQFRLAAPFADFNYVVAGLQSTPVQPSWDSGKHRGASFQLDPISTGPYEFRSYEPGKLLVMVRNPYWRQASDPQVRQLPAEIVVHMGLSQQAADAALLAGTADADLSGADPQGQAATEVLGNAASRAKTDNPFDGQLDFAYINTQVIPDLHCREAIEYAADKTAMLSAVGGTAAGAIASTVLPPTIPGYQSFSGYAATADPSGAVAVAKTQLRLCGQAHGFTTAIAYPRGDRNQEAAAQALRASLARAGISARLVGLPYWSYYSESAGNPEYVVSHHLGILLGQWRASWPDGYAFLNELAAGSAIAYGGGNANIAQIDDAAINGLFSRERSATGDAGAAVWRQVSQRIMALAAILPIADQKVLLYRDPRLTNVYADEVYGLYNYAVLGVK